MGWTDDPDIEGLMEENPFIFIATAIIGIVAASVLYVFGIEYNPGWFEGQNLLSTMGIIFLLIFIPAIAISTLTGKSDLVKWEALFLLISVGMIFIGNGFDFSKFMDSFMAQISALGNMQVNQVLMALVIIIGIAIAFAVGSGHKVSGGAVLIIVVLLAAIGIMNIWNAGTFDNFGNYVQDKGWAYAIGKAIGDFTAGLATSEVGIYMGFGCIAVGIILTVIPNFSTPIGVLLIIIGSGLVGPTVYDEVSDWWGGESGETGGPLTDSDRAGGTTDYVTGAAIGGTAAAAISAGLILTGTGPGAIVGVPLIAAGLLIGGASGNWVNWDSLWGAL